MNIKCLLNEINLLQDLLEEDNTIFNKIKIKLAMRRIHKIIDKKAREQAQLMYDQTYQLYADMIESNLNEKIF